MKSRLSASEIAKDICQGAVYYFADKDLLSKEPHYFIVLNREPQADPFLVLVVASSKIEERKRLGRNLGYSPETMVTIKQGDFDDFLMETIIDCNSIFQRKLSALVSKCGAGSMKGCDSRITGRILRDIILGVCASVQVPSRVKTMITVSGSS